MKLRLTLLLVCVTCFIGCATHEKKMAKADQRWLEVARQKAVNGETVSTTNVARVKMLAKWATENGYSVTVRK